MQSFSPDKISKWWNRLYVFFKASFGIIISFINDH